MNTRPNIKRTPRADIGYVFYIYNYGTDFSYADYLRVVEGDKSCICNEQHCYECKYLNTQNDERSSLRGVYKSNSLVEVTVFDNADDMVFYCKITLATEYPRFCKCEAMADMAEKMNMFTDTIYDVEYDENICGDCGISRNDAGMFDCDCIPF